MNDPLIRRRPAKTGGNGAYIAAGVVVLVLLAGGIGGYFARQHYRIASLDRQFAELREEGKVAVAQFQKRALPAEASLSVEQMKDQEAHQKSLNAKLKIIKEKMRAVLHKRIAISGMRPGDRVLLAELGE